MSNSEDVAAGVVAKIRSEGEVTVSDRPFNKVSTNGEPYNRYELTEFLRLGPAIIADRILKLKRYIANPQFSRKKSSYQVKLIQLQKISKINLDPPPTAT